MLLIMKKDKSFKNKEKSIEELVFDLLQKGSISINELIKEINRKRNSATKQGVYRVLRKLNEEEKKITARKSKFKFFNHQKQKGKAKYPHI